jgi:hypothetical protein
MLLLAASTLQVLHEKELSVVVVVTARSIHRFETDEKWGRDD